MDRTLTLSAQIAASYEKCQDFNAGGTFLANHILYLATADDDYIGANIVHIQISFAQLYSLKEANLNAFEDKKSAKTSIGTQEVIAEASVFDSDLLENDKLYHLLLLVLEQLKDSKGRVAEEVLTQAGPLLNLLQNHVEHVRFDVFRAPASRGSQTKVEKVAKNGAPPSKVLTFLDVYNLAREAFDISYSFFDTKIDCTSSPGCNESYKAFLNICQEVVEAWFFSPDQIFDNIASVVERGQQVSLAFSCVEPSFTTAISSLLISAHILHCICEGDKVTAITLSKQITPYWVASIQQHQNMVSTSRKDTMKTPTSFFQLTASQMQRSPSVVADTLCLCVAVSLGALCGFKGDTFHGQLSLSDALYLTQEVSSRLLCLKKILLNLELSIMYISTDGDNIAPQDSTGHGALNRGKIRPSILELVPMGRVCILFQIQQVEAAFGVCFDQNWLSNFPNGVDDVGLQMNDDVVSTLLHVSQWILIRTFGGGNCTDSPGDLSHSDKMELVRVIDVLSSSCGKLFAALLQVEKEWLLFMISQAKGVVGKSIAEFSFTTNLLREQNGDESSISTFISKLQNISMSSTSSYWKSYLPEIVEFRIGIAMWLGKQTYRIDKTKCLAQLIKVAKLNNQFGGVYSFIGHYYFLVLKDTARAAKCYIKALAFDPMDAEAGVSLSQIYIEAGEVSKVKKLWSDVNILTVSHAYWCFSLSGQLNFCQQNYEECVGDFQKSLELWGRDVTAWHSLSSCYSSLGQNVAAFKSLECALALISSKDPFHRDQWETMRMVLVCELAEVERRMGSFQESHDHFLEVSHYTPSKQSSFFSDYHVIALKGIGDVCLALGYERLTCGWSRGACEVVMQGIKAMDTVIELLADNMGSCRDGVLSCMLKLKGDLCAFCRHFSPADIVQSTTFSVCEESNDYSGAGLNSSECISYDWILSQVAEAEITYRKLLAVYMHQLQSLSEAEISDTGADEHTLNVVSTWCDIGTALYFQCMLELSSRGQGAGLFSTNYILSSSDCPPARHLKKAAEAFAQGLLLQPGHSGCWNGAGLCCHFDDSLQELCLVRSTLPDVGENPNPAGYANLGNMYLAHNRQKCAKECLSALQLLESNPLHWLVLGGLVEKSSPDATCGESAKIAHQQSIFDAYTAALEISKPIEGLLGVAVAFMQSHGFLTNAGELIWSNHVSWPLRIDLVALRYSVEQPLGSFLYRRPNHPFAWSILAWAYVQRQAWHVAAKAYISLLDVVERVVTRCGRRFGDDEEEQYYVQNIVRLVTSAMQGLDLCRRMSPQSHSSPISTSDYPSIANIFPDFAGAHVVEVSSLTKENLIMSAFENCDFDQCYLLLQTRQDEILSSVQADDVNDFSRIRHFVRLMQMVDFFIGNCSKENKPIFHPCLIAVGRLLSGLRENKAESDEQSDVHRQSYVLNAYRVYPEGFLVVGQALLNEGSRCPELLTDAVRVLELGITLHPRHDAILRMLGRADHTQLENSAIGSLDIARSMLVSSCTDVNTVSNEITKMEVQCDELRSGFVSDAGTDEGSRTACICTQRRVDCGEEVITAFSDSVALHAGYKIKTGQRCNQSDRKDILTALWMDPGNLTTWAVLAGSIFSDVALGPTSATECKVDESKDDDQVKVDEEALTVPCRGGAFSNSELVKTCVSIITFLHAQPIVDPCEGAVNSPFLELFCPQGVAASLFCDWTSCSESTGSTECDHSRSLIMVDAGLRDVFKSVSAARSKAFVGNYHDAVPLYENAIREITKCNYSSAVLSKIHVELGNIFSFLCFPDKACEQYHMSAAAAVPEDSNSQSNELLMKLSCAIAYTRKSATSGDHKDVTTAREYVEAVCNQPNTAPSFAATAHLATALIWLGLSKPNKAAQEVVEAKAIFKSVEVPFKVEM